jgi:hypothetical protein
LAGRLTSAGMLVALIERHLFGGTCVNTGCMPTKTLSNRPYATRISTASVSPASMFLLNLNPIEPPWYGPVCPVVGEGRHREVSPYPDL